MTDTRDIESIVRESVLRYRMVETGDRIVAAVSGGADSVCLLHILMALSGEFDLDLIVAHYDHTLRKGEDEQETEFVRQMALSAGLPFVTERASNLKSGMPSLEESARQARYDFFERVRSDWNAQKTALGHTMNDQAETVIMRLLRGSGPSGLSGIPPVREGSIIRPLIDVKRDEIVQFLQSKGLGYVSDSSNRDKKYLRNSVRLDLLPHMKKYQPRLIENLSRLSNVLREEDTLLDAQADAWVSDNAVSGSGQEILVDLKTFNLLASPLKNRVIRVILKRLLTHLLGIDYKHLAYITSLAGSSRSQALIDLPGSVRVKKSYGRLVFYLNANRSVSEYSYTVTGRGEVYVEETCQTVLIEEMKPEIAKSLSSNMDRSAAFIDGDRLEYPLVIRNIRPGDRFIPLGMNGHKKIKNYFADIKLPFETRRAVPLVVMNEKIVWICGFRIDERFKVTSETERVLKITCTPVEPLP